MGHCRSVSYVSCLSELSSNIASMPRTCMSTYTQEEKMKEYRREKRKERKKRGRGHEDTTEEGEELDPEMAAVMGFSGFGGTKKKAT